MSFSLDLKKFAEKAGDNSDKVVRKVVTDVGSRVVMRTPVGDPDYWQSPPPPGYAGGRARANWQYGEGSPKKTEIKAEDKTGAESISNISKSVPQKAGGKIHYISNNVPYIMALESGKGSPRQAPNGMVGVTVSEFQGIIDKATK